MAGEAFLLNAKSRNACNRKSILCTAGVTDNRRTFSILDSLLSAVHVSRHCPQRVDRVGRHEHCVDSVRSAGFGRQPGDDSGKFVWGIVTDLPALPLRIAGAMCSFIFCALVRLLSTQI